MAYLLQANDDSILNAHFDLDGNTIVLHSRSGGTGAGGRNPDYPRALRLLLERLSAASLPITKAWVDSSRVQSMPMSDRVILDEKDAGTSVAELAGRMASRMQAVGRKQDVKSNHGNHTKRIRLQLPGGIPASKILSVLRAVPSKKDFRSEERLPTSELAKVTPEHVWRAVQRLREGDVEHGFGKSTDYDVLLEGGTRLPPKAVFGVAATEALGYPVQPRHFTAGVDSPCFNILRTAGFRIVPKGADATVDPEPERTDVEWSEGGPKLRQHLRRERASGLREAKKAEFRRTHGGRLLCERCGEDPVERYKTEDAEACIEVHHSKVLVSEMQDGHKTQLQDVQCLCANCHRLAHREIRKAAASGA
jgi:hypothetical protein